MPEQAEPQTGPQTEYERRLHGALRNMLIDDFASQQSALIAWFVLESAGIFQTSFTGNSETFFREGKRSVGLRLLAELERIDPSGFAKLQMKMVDLRIECAGIDAAKEGQNAETE